MKKITYVCLFFMFIVLLTGCRTLQGVDINDLKESEYKEEDKEVEISVEEENITSKTEQLTISFNNLSDYDYTYGKDLHLELQMEGKWYVVPTLENVAWEDIGYFLPSNETNELEFPLIDSYGELKKGNYLIVKELYSNGEPIVVFAEFKIK